MAVFHTRKVNGEIVKSVSHEGATLGLTSRYNSSMDVTVYFAIVWDEAAYAVVQISYASDMDAISTQDKPTIDATPEARAKALAFHFNTIYPRLLEEAQRAAIAPRRGADVIVTRGRKLAKGTTGRILWIGEDSYGGTRAGIKVRGADKLQYTSLDNLDNLTPLPVNLEEIKQRALDLCPKY